MKSSTSLTYIEAGIDSALTKKQNTSFWRVILKVCALFNTLTEASFWCHQIEIINKYEHGAESPSCLPSVL